MFSDSSWQDDWGRGRRKKHSRINDLLHGMSSGSLNMLDLVALSSAETEYNEACLACQVISHLHMTLNELEQVNMVK
jgi:hypothetical protein